MAANANAKSGRALALARRRAMSQGGKAALGAQAQQAPAATRAAPAVAPSSALAPASAPAAAPRTARPASAGQGARKASLARRQAMSQQGKRAIGTGDRVRGAGDRAASRQAEQAPAPAPKGDCGCGCGGSGDCAGDKRKASAPAAASRPRPRRANRPAVAHNPGKAAALARRRAQSSRGKAGIGSAGMTEAQTARAVNPQLSGRELARALREQRSRRGASGQKKSAPSGRRRKAGETVQGAAQDAPWKVGISETGHGQSVTGTLVGRKRSVTGDEASTCRDITGTEYLGADIFREFCQAEPPKSPQRGSRTSTARGNAVTGNEVGRSSKVTGDEPGTCQRVTGSEYLSTEQLASFCGNPAEPGASRVTSAETRRGKSVTGNNVERSSRVTGNESGAGRQLTGTQYTNPSEGAAPAKVGLSKTLRGGSVSGTLVGRRERMTGDEAGSCRHVTGDDYVGEEQFSRFCDSRPQPRDRKVGISGTHGGEEVTGSMTGRSLRVTGNEPGTCKTITGTPYAGTEQYATWCEAPQAQAAKARMQPRRRDFGAPLTGQQPAPGAPMTGADKGACETVSGTPYVGADQVAAICTVDAAEPGSPDFPQPLDALPGSGFSIEALAAAQPAQRSKVTGAVHGNGQITGAFDKAGGKVTGTEEARFGNRAEAQPLPQLSATAGEIDGRIKSRITGEGQDAGSKITGDDWDRGDRVTGTEGASATRRNTTLRGAPTGAMGARARQPAEAPQPVSKVTGASGNTEHGAMVTYSGGARG